ncbi:RNA-binding protein NOB1 isoform 1-T1 [Menidia menidia]
MAPARVEHVVADAGAFLKKAPLQDIGTNIYTLKDVVDEIRDKPTRRSLAFLPYQLQLKDPHPEHVRHVTEFSKKTGDYPSLSATDIRVLALTYQLELEHVGSQHLRPEPDLKVNVQSTRRHPEAPVNVPGFHFPSKKPDRRPPHTEAAPPHKEAETPHTEAAPPHTEASPPENQQFNSFQFWREPLAPVDCELLALLGPAEAPEPRNQPDQTQADQTQADLNQAEQNQADQTLADSPQFNSFQFWREPLAPVDGELLALLEGGSSAELQDDQSDEEDEEDKENDDGGGWITPANIGRLRVDSDWTAPADVTVGCLTTDFAMQNVLLQMGLNVLSVNGLLIQQARSYVLRCHACFRTTSNMNKVFCPHCGNQTLKKLAVTVGTDGSINMHFSKNPKVLNPRGLRHSLPLPQGGKHANNPHLVEDQRFPQQRLSRKARQKTDVFHPDYEAGGSPFSQNDVYSRAANLHIRDGQSGAGRRRENPNAARRFSKK